MSNLHILAQAPISRKLLRLTTPRCLSCLRDTPKRIGIPRAKHKPLPATVVLRWVLAVVLAIVVAVQTDGAP